MSRRPVSVVNSTARSSCLVDDQLQNSRKRYQMTISKICEKYEFLSKLCPDDDNEQSSVYIKVAEFGFLLEADDDADSNHDFDSDIPEDDENEPVLIDQEDLAEMNDDCVSLISSATNCTIDCCSVVQAAYRMAQSNVFVENPNSKKVQNSVKRKATDDNCQQESKRSKMKRLSREACKATATVATVTSFAVKLPKTIVALAIDYQQLTTLKIHKGVFDSLDPLRLCSKDDCLGKFLSYGRRPLLPYEEKTLAIVQPNVDRLMQLVKYRFLLKLYGASGLEALQRHCKRLPSTIVEIEFEDFSIDSDLVVHGQCFITV